MTSLGCLAFTVRMIYVQSYVFKLICWKEKVCLCHFSSDFYTSAYRSEGFFQHNNSPTHPVFQLDVNRIDHLVAIQCSAGKLWVLAVMKMQNEDLRLPPKHGYRPRSHPQALSSLCHSWTIVCQDALSCSGRSQQSRSAVTMRGCCSCSVRAFGWVICDKWHPLKCQDPRFPCSILSPMMHQKEGTV